MSHWKKQRAFSVIYKYFFMLITENFKLKFSYDKSTSLTSLWV